LRNALGGFPALETGDAERGEMRVVEITASMMLFYSLQE
jgi:hypothetical protein